jgi:hypothetical protein
MFRTATAERTDHHSEFAFNKEQIIARMGEVAINSSELGINDPLTHLRQYTIRGEEALVGIREDIETDIAERLPKTPFVNHVDFKFTGDDFVSSKDRVSMNSMTKTNLQIFKTESASNPDLVIEFERAEIEAQEVTKLTDWFKKAPIGAYLIFESLPIGKQKIAISRIYQKTSEDNLEGCFVSLYNSSVGQFNKFREELCTSVPTCHTEKEILQNHYEFYEPKLTSSEKFIDFYVGVYDHLLQEQKGRQYNFGLEINKTKEKQNGLFKVRKQPKLTSIYLDTVKALASSKGKITPEIMKINEKLSLGYQFRENQDITVKLAHDIMSDVIKGITSVIDQADDKLLHDLGDSNTGQDANYAAMSHFGGQARAAGETYASNGCPEYGRNDTTESESANNTGIEYNAIYMAFNMWGRLDNFGQPKIGVCRIPNCPSHGKSEKYPEKALVGGCDVCVGCHKLFEKGQKPQRIYAEQEKIKKQKQAKNQKEIEEKRKIKSAEAA